MLTHHITTVAQRTATGTDGTLRLPSPCKDFAIMVKGTGAAPTAWTVDLQGSLDGTNYSTLATHNTASTDGATVWTNAKPVSYIRFNTTALTLGGASAIIIVALAVP